MITTFKFIGPVVGLALALSAPVSAQAPDQQPRSPGAPPSADRPATPPSSQQKADAAGQTTRGEIVSLDSTGKILTIKMADGTEQNVRYADETTPREVTPRILAGSGTETSPITNVFGILERERNSDLASGPRATIGGLLLARSASHRHRLTDANRHVALSAAAILDEQRVCTRHDGTPIGRRNRLVQQYLKSQFLRAR